MRSLLLIAACLAWLFPARAAEPHGEPCTRWADVETGLVFPSRMGGLELKTRTAYGDNDWSLRYDSDDRRAVHAGGTHLHVYAPHPSAKGMDAEKELEACIAEIRRMEQDNACYDVKVAEKSQSGKLRKSGLPYVWRGLSMKSRQDGERSLLAVFVLEFRGRFLALSYSTVVSDRVQFSETEFPPRFILILGELDNMIKATQDARAVDVYAIRDLQTALTALRTKWSGVEFCVDVWDKPDHTDKNDNLNHLQRWCEEDMEKRCATFEQVARAGIALRTQPDLWYYNLACALARQRHAEPAFTALEQAVAAGYHDGAHMRKDADLESLRADPRFERLAGLAAAWTVDVARPQERAFRQGRTLPLSEKNVVYDMWNRAFDVEVVDLTSPSPESVPVLYLDRGNGARERVMQENPSFVEVAFPAAAVKRRRHVGPCGFMAYDVRSKHYQPVFAVCGLQREASPSNAVVGWGATITQEGASRLETAGFGLLAWNVLPFYAAGTDWGGDGIDRHLGWFPGCLEYAGNDPAPFVRAANVALQEMRPSVRTAAITNGVLAQALISLVRGDVWRPTMSPEDLDFTAITNRARALADVPPSIPIMLKGSCRSGRSPAADVWEPPYNNPHLTDGLMTELFIHDGTERTRSYVVHASTRLDDDSTLSWEVLQGDPAKVRIVPLTNTFASVRIEVDWHDVFEVKLPKGRSLKSARVDVGCRAVRRGLRSLPSIVSVYCPPNASRVYDEHGRLASIDYAQPPLPAYQPTVCVRGDWRDEFHWSKDGELLGWTRHLADARQEFTRDGLVVRTRDPQGRPSEVCRSLRATFFQRTLPWMTKKEIARECQWQEIQFDDVAQEGAATTLLWRYAYTNATDRFGRPSPVPPVAWTNRPELCSLVDFSATNTGFRLPIFCQMQASEKLYTMLKRSAGLKLPQNGSLKMSFCPWRPSAADGWRIDTADIERECTRHLRILGDGACRLYIPGKDGSDGIWRSVRASRRIMNECAEWMMYERLDGAYERCDEQTAAAVFRAQLGAEVWSTTAVAAKGRFAERPRNRGGSFAVWRIAPKMYLGILCDWGDRFETRLYMFARTPTAEPSEAVEVVWFSAPPSRAIGNTVLAAAHGDADALNNLAVLVYGGVTSLGAYDESTVARQLMKAARKGNVTAMRNLAVLYTNRGEADRAKQFLEAARLKEEADRSRSTP